MFPSRTTRIRRLTTLISGALLVGGLLVLGTSTAQGAAGSGHITGTVTDSGGAGIKGIDVIAYRPATIDGEDYWAFVAEDYTDSSGAYDIAGLAGNSSYHVFFYDDSDTYVSEVWDNRGPIVEGDAVAVTSPGTTADVDARLDRPAHITGRLTKAGGTSAGPGVPVSVNRLVEEDGGSYWSEEATTYTVVGGYYDVTGFGAGTYRLGFAEGDGSYVAEFWNNAADLDGADDVTVGPESTVTGKDAELVLKPPNVTTTSHITVDASGRSKINVACVEACTGYLQIYSDLAGAKRSDTIAYSVGSHSYKGFTLTHVPLDATTGAYARLFQTSPRSQTVQYDKLQIVHAVPNALKTTAKITVSPYGRGTVNVSCSQACSGYAQVWSDGTATGPKSSVFHYSLGKAGYMPMPLTGLSYVDSTAAKVRLAIASPTAFPGDSPQFNSLQLVRGPQNVVKTSSWTKVSSSGKATVNVSCTMACEGYVQLRIDEAGTLTSANVAHYKLAGAGWMPLYFTGVKHIDSATWLARIAATQPATSKGVTFNPLRLIAG